MGDEHSRFKGAGGPASLAVETQQVADPLVDWVTSTEGGCQEDNQRDDCPCGYCGDRYRQSSFYLEGMFRDSGDMGQVHNIVLRAVEDAVVISPPYGQALEVDLCGYYWDSQPGCRQVVLKASMNAECLREKLHSSLVSELSNLRCEGAPDILVDRGRYEVGHVMDRLVNGMFWQGLSLERAWPKHLPARAVRFGNPLKLCDWVQCGQSWFKSVCDSPAAVTLRGSYWPEGFNDTGKEKEEESEGVSR